MEAIKGSNFCHIITNIYFLYFHFRFYYFGILLHKQLSVIVEIVCFKKSLWRNTFSKTYLCISLLNISYLISIHKIFTNIDPPVMNICLLNIPVVSKCVHMCFVWQYRNIRHRRTLVIAICEIWIQGKFLAC